jgi:hypothetical protein
MLRSHQHGQICLVEVTVSDKIPIPVDIRLPAGSGIWAANIIIILQVSGGGCTRRRRIDGPHLATRNKWRTARLPQPKYTCLSSDGSR